MGREALQNNLFSVAPTENRRPADPAQSCFTKHGSVALCAYAQRLLMLSTAMPGLILPCDVVGSGPLPLRIPERATARHGATVL